MSTPTRKVDRILVYQRPGMAWCEPVAAYKKQGLLLGVHVFTRKEKCYKGPERCAKVWTESESIASDYAEIGIENELEQNTD